MMRYRANLVSAVSKYVASSCCPHRCRARLAQVEPSALLSAAEDDALALLVAAATDWGRPVPHCPEWDAAGLVRHTGGTFLWMEIGRANSELPSRQYFACLLLLS